MSEMVCWVKGRGRVGTIEEVPHEKEMVVMQCSEDATLFGLAGEKANDAHSTRNS